MTTVKFHLDGERIVSFEMRGHSGYAEEGEDIVCAAVSSAAYLVEATVNDILGLEAYELQDESENVIILRLPAKLPEREEFTCQSLLAGMMLYLTNLHDVYPDNITVMEV